MIWKHHPIHTLYEISDTGEIRSYMPCARRREIPHVLKQYTDKYGYKYIWPIVNGKRKALKVHRLALETFVGFRFSWEECRHLDGNKENNALSNLAWGSSQENADDAIAHGSSSRGEERYNHVLLKNDVYRIRELHDQGFSSHAIAEILSKETPRNISIGMVKGVIQRKTWKWVK